MAHRMRTGQAVLSEGGLLLYEERQARVLVVVRYHPDQLGEVPGVPLAHAHHKGVDVLVQRVQQGDGLDHHVVHAVHIELHLRRVKTRARQGTGVSGKQIFSADLDANIGSSACIGNDNAPAAHK